MTNTGRKKYIALISMILMLCATFTSCVSKPTTIEELINSNKEIKEQLSSSNTSEMSVDIRGNEIIYTYDLSGVEGATEENLKEDSMIKILKKTLDGQSEAFSNVCKQIEEESEISGVSATVNYTYKGEVLASKTFSSAGEVKNGESEKAETEDTEDEKIEE